MILVWLGLLLLIVTGVTVYSLYTKALEAEGKHLAFLVEIHAHHLETILSISPSTLAVPSGNLSPQASELLFLKNSSSSFKKENKISLVQILPVWFKITPFPGTPKEPVPVIQKTVNPQILPVEPLEGSHAFIGSDQYGREELVVRSAVKGTPYWVLGVQDLKDVQRPFVKAGLMACFFQGTILAVGFFVLKGSKATTEEELKRREAKIRAIVASAGEGIVTFNEFGLIESFNETAGKMFGYKEKEVLGKPFHLLMTSDELENWDTFLTTYQPSGIKRIPVSLKELTGKRRDGTQFVMALTLTEAPIWGHRFFTAIVQDITQRKLVERRLSVQYAVAQVLAKCTSIQEATPEILRAICESLGWQLGTLWQVDPARLRINCVEFWGAPTDRFSEFIALTQGTSFVKGAGLPGRVWEKGDAIWIPDSAKDANFPRAPMAAKEGLHAAFGFPIRLGDVTFGVMEFFNREIQEPDEALLHQMVALGSQIGQFMQRMEMEMSLRAREEQTRSILDSALDAVIALDEQGNIMEWNRQAEQVFGWNREEILGQSLAEIIVPPQFREAHSKGIQRYVELGESHILNTRFEMMGLRRDGQEIPLELAITAVRFKGQVIFNGFLRDLTERRQAEEALLKSEEQLRQAQKMEAIGTLAGGIAHDFNNILSAIIGYTELAMSQVGVSSSILPKLQEVLKAGYRAKNLIRQILTFSRQDTSGKKVIFLQPVIEEALTLLRASLPSTITLTQELQSSTSPVLADATQIHQVIMNLGANAEYAMRETGGTLRVLLDEVNIDESSPMIHHGLGVGRFMRLQVMDSGLGMTPSVKKRIFDPFFTTKDVGEGTGMGLAVIHGIVRGHGGAIQVESEEGVGSNFILYFPSSDKSVGDPGLGRLPETFYGQGRIMFVDDEVPITRWAKDMLEELGYHVVIHTNGQEAIRDFTLHFNDYDALITDQTMPGMTGEQLAQHVLNIRPEFPVILCSGFSYTMSELKAKSMGIRAYLIKPVLIADLAQTLLEALGQSISHKGLR
ncbi:MAG: PAS domain S-box protein [Nitrospirales bacterium]|nr:PAS domain S-box protein [Nitrospirales bacterium]